MKEHLKSVVSLTVICAVLAGLLAFANFVTAPIIAETEKNAAQQSLLVVMPNGEDFEEVDISTLELPDVVKQAYKEKNGGHVVTVESAGYSSGMIVMVGVDKDGKVTGATCLSSGETLGYEKTYGEKTVGATIDTVDSLDSISGATKTVNGYKSALKTAIGAAIVLSGGSADLRSEEEILQENLKNALPDGDSFSEIFVPVELKTEGVTLVYEPSNKSGLVFALGDDFYGVRNDGSVLIEGSSSIKDTLTQDIKAIKEANLTEVDISKYEISAQIKKAYKTDSSFVFELEANGYGILGDKWTASGKPIKIKASVSRAGEVICVQTVEQNESQGFGDACADSKFYSQFNGKTSETVNQIDAISGATITTGGYKNAIVNAIEAAKIMKGE